MILSTCARDAQGNLILAWQHQEPATAIIISANGQTLKNLDGAATGVTLDAASLPLEDPLRVCVENGSQPPACCSVNPLPAFVHHWPFNESLVDVIGGNDGVFTGDVEPLYVSGFDGKAAGAIQFDGIDDYVRVERTIATDFTIAAWVLMESPQVGDAGSQYWQGTGLIYADLPGAADDFGASITGNFFAFGVGNPDQTAHSTSAVAGTGWTHVAAVREVDDAGTSSIRVYVNGVLEEDQQHPNIRPLTAQATITIGGNTIDNRYYNGAIDDVRIYNYALADGEIADLAKGVAATRFRRGDVDASGTVDISDPINNLTFQFLGAFQPTCKDALDDDDSGVVDISDPIYSLVRQFLGGPAQPAPGPDQCGTDPTPDRDDQGNPADLGCDSYSAACN